MIKKFYFMLLIMIIMAIPANAVKLPVKISPLQIISTNKDEVEIGDKISFVVVKNVFYKNKILIKSGAEIFGVVDFVHENGWGGDCAEIQFSKFYTTDIIGNRVEINSPLLISGNNEFINRFVHNTKFRQLKMVPMYIGHYIRGSEIFIEPDTESYNIFMEK